MRIGFDTTPLAATQSGVGVYTANLLKHLPDQLATQDTLIPLSHNTTTRKLNKTLWMQAILPWQLRADGFDICHFTNSVAPLWSPCPTVLTIHDMTLWLYPEYHYFKRLVTMRPFISPAARHARAIITVSESVKIDIVRILGVPANRVHVIYSAPAEQFVPRDPATGTQEAAKRAQHNLPERFILSVGTLEPRKNLVRLLEAFALLRRDYLMPIGLVLVGARGWKDHLVFAAIERLGLQQSVRYLGYVPTEQLVQLYHMADMLAFPSLYEGCGLPILEAMACGTPVLTTDRGGLREMAGDATQLVDPLSVESIADGLGRVLSDPDRRAALTANGFRHVSAFNWQVTAANTYRVYQSLC